MRRSVHWYAYIIVHFVYSKVIKQIDISYRVLYQSINGMEIRIEMQHIKPQVNTFHGNSADDHDGRFGWHVVATQIDGHLLHKQYKSQRGEARRSTCVNWSENRYDKYSE